MRKIFTHFGSCEGAFGIDYNIQGKSTGETVRGKQKPFYYLGHWRCTQNSQKIKLSIISADPIAMVTGQQKILIKPTFSEEGTGNKLDKINK